MGTHPIFESDFDCLTEMTSVEIKLKREKIGSPLGFKILGGSDSPYANAKFDHDGIYVSKLERRPALDSGLSVGDQLLQVDGQSLISVTHLNAIRFLKASSGLEVLLEVRKTTQNEKRPKSTQKEILHQVQHDGDENDENLNEVPKINIESVSIEESSESSVEPEYVIKVENHKSESELFAEELIETKLEVEIDLKSEMSSSLTDSGFSEQEMPSRDSDEISEVHEEVHEDEKSEAREEVHEVDKCPEETSEKMNTEDNVTEDSTEDIVTRTNEEPEEVTEEIIEDVIEEVAEEISEDKTEDLQDSSDKNRTIEIRTLDAEGQNSSMTILSLLGIGGLFAFALYKLKY